MTFTGERQPHGAITSFWANVDHDTVIKDDLKPECRKVHTDRVTPIKAGDPIGYLGIYQIPDDGGNAYTRQQMHFEIFTPDSEMVDYLLNNPLGLTRGKQYLRLTKGTVLMLPGTEAQTTESYTLRFDHAVPLEGLKTEEHNGKTGYRIDVEGRSGYIEKTDNLEIVSQHDGAKLGFQIVREDDPNHDGFLDPELISGVFLEIYKAIDADGNRQLSVEELVAAKDNSVLKEVWSKLIAHHPTEWRNHNGTARRLSEMLTDPEIPPEDQEYCRNLLPQELVRMQMLSFWDRLNPRLPESSYYFHPVRFVECLSDDSIMPSWLIIAMEEARKWANAMEDKIATNYHREVGYPSNLVTEPWCASFVNYCFKRVNIAYPTDRPAYSRAYISNKQFFEINKPCLGSIRVSRRGTTDSGHVTFVFAKNQSGALLCLGGNQSDQIRLSAYSVYGQASKYYLPLSYKDEYSINKEKLEEFAIYADEGSANRELFGITAKGGSRQS